MSNALYGLGGVVGAAVSTVGILWCVRFTSAHLIAALIVAVGAVVQIYCLMRWKRTLVRAMTLFSASSVAAAAVFQKYMLNTTISFSKASTIVGVLVALSCL